MAYLINTDHEPDDTTAFVDILLADVRAGEQDAASIKALQEVEASLWRAAGRDPECSAYHAACTTVLYMLQQRQP